MTIQLLPVQDLRALLQLDKVKPDAFLGASPQNGWERIYGGQVVAQALRAAALTVESGHPPHSLHAYFVRPGDERQPVLFEVERVRDGRSFTTRQVVAYQANGAILNLIASFQDPEPGPDVQSVEPPPETPDPLSLPRDPSDLFFDSRVVVRAVQPEVRLRAWIKATDHLGDDPVLHACALAYLSDELPMGAVAAPHPLGGQWERLMAASLDHALWFHRPARADDWLLFDLRGSGVASSRGLAFGRVYDARGNHVASIGQEGLVRERR
ncbi:MAG TPA: acyl-CoA thioesterase domain-containing protein [Acidimicrobiales bacterium]